MNFSPDEEERFKEMLKSDKKEELLVELSKEIEKKEKEMMKSISRDYMNIINKCSDLEKVKQKLPEIVNINNELLCSVSDAVIQHANILHDIEENSIVESRLNLVVSEMKEILGFINIAFEYENTDKEDREDPLYYYKMAKNVLEMEKKLCMFEKYRFFVNVNQICIRSRKLLADLMIKDIDLWMKSASNNIRQVGMEINEMFWKDKEKSYIFDPLGSLRHQFISKSFLCILHESKRLGIGSKVVERVNEKRKVFGERIGEVNSPLMISDAAGFILWSHYLSALDSDFKMHNQLVIGILSKSKVLHESQNFSQVRKMLITLRKLTVHLGIDYENVDRIISSVAIGYFETQGPKDVDLESNGVDQLKLSMTGFIDECNDFVSNIFQFSNELDELLAKKIDQYLCKLLDEGKDNMDLFLDGQSAARDVLRHAIEKNDFYRNVEFNCMSEIDKGNKRFMEEVIKQREKEIDKLFGTVTKSGDFGVDLLKLFSRVRELRFPEDVNAEIKRTLVVYIRDRFTDTMKDKSLASQKRRIVEGHLCSFYGYLRNNEPSFQSILEPSVERGKS
ncbi:hypothetical protein P7C65_01s1g00920 [Encephalitozoon intestinalis]